MKQDSKAKRVITLCIVGKADYINSGYQLIFTGNRIKSECDMCAVRMGFDYHLEDRRG